MKKDYLKNILFVVIQLFLLICALYLGKEWSNGYNIIPKFLFTLPSVTVADTTFLGVIKIFIVFGVIFYSLSALKFGPVNFSNPRRTIQELFTTLLAFTFCTLYIFFATDLPFSPDFFAGTGLVYFGLLVFTQFVFEFLGKKTSAVKSALLLMKGLGLNLIRTTFSIGGILVIIFAMSPLILMKAYTSNRDVANVVTQIRLALNQESYEGWLLVNALPDMTFRQPIMAQFSPDNNSIIYILERHGRLYKVNYDVAGEKTLVLDFSNRVGEVEMENGALGFDLHPQFDLEKSGHNAYVYIFYTDYTDVAGGDQTNRLSRFNLADNTPEERLSSEYPLIEFKRLNDGYHNGGSVEFGPDGFLYIALGESSNSKSHQKIDYKLHGGILRIDVDQQGGDISHPIVRQAEDTLSQGYFIPSDNPFAGQENALEEFWALGLRNPFRISFDPKTEKIWAGDVGSTKFEEINIIEKGGNYQFPYVEGVTPGKTGKPENFIGQEKGPAYFYGHTAYERSIIGGIVYRDGKNSELTGKYLYMDNYSGRIYSLAADAPVLADPITLTRSEQVAQRGVTSMISAPNGDILLTTLGRAEDQSGRLMKLTPSSQMAMAALEKQQAEQPPQADETARIAPIKLYNVHCARCHGTGGMGDGPDKEYLESLLPDFTNGEFIDARSDAFWFNVIKNGGEAESLSYEMPLWEGILDDKEIQEMIQLLRNFKERK